MIDPDYFLRVLRQREEREQREREQREERRQRRQQRQRRVREEAFPVPRGEVFRQEEPVPGGEVLRHEEPVLLYRDPRYLLEYGIDPMDVEPPIPIPMEVPIVVEHPPQNDPPMTNEPVANESEPLNRFGYIDPRNQYILEHAIPLDENGMFDPNALIDVEALGREFDQLHLHGRGVMRQPEELIEPLDGRQFFVSTRDPELPLPDTPEQTWFVTVNIPGYTNQYPVDVLLLNELRTYILEGFEEYPSIPDVRLTAYNNGRSANLLITTGQNYIDLIKQMDFYFPDSLARAMDPNLRFTTEDVFNFELLDF